MRAKNLSEIRVYRKAEDAANAVSALLKRPVFGKDFNLKDQLSRSSSRVAPLIAEGHGQLTDRHLAVYLGRARGSVLETIAHLAKALNEQFISAAEHSTLADMYDHIGRMLTRWIKHLQESDWKDRG
ncbi:MAG TPA: four helix bundle protein [Vicinamibacterales bacterium]|nr:four helix bundle protein [Vicinamibacterales bacterium]